ncbi:Histone deacetylase hda1 [Rhizophlyctis rosea]|uniref:Histone deacetylase hda1 n=1 Tax=Rhizophlyctis rosea TaxID=64517 RepID=A0AAD5SIH0_9FUNG|nr:Histone deacetylase hda1 [Rhizophlyctis rosea]
MTHMLKSLAGGKLVVCLEGGYNIDSVANSVLAVTSVLLGHPAEPLAIPKGPSAACIDTVQRVAEAQAPYWKCLRPAPPSSTVDELAPDSRSGFLLRAALRMYRDSVLEKAMQLLHLPVDDPHIVESFAGSIHASQNYKEHLGFLFVIVRPSWDDVGGRVNTRTNRLQTESSFVHDVGMEILAELHREHAVVEIDIDVSSMQKEEASLIAGETLKWFWDKRLRDTSARYIFLLGTGIGSEAMATLVTARALEPQFATRILRIASIVSHGIPPVVHQDAADWYFERSRVYVGSNAPAGRTLPDVSNLAGRCVSIGAEDRIPSELLRNLKSKVLAYFADAAGDLYKDQIRKGRREKRTPAKAPPKLDVSSPVPSPRVPSYGGSAFRRHVEISEPPAKRMRMTPIPDDRFYEGKGNALSRPSPDAVSPLGTPDVGEREFEMDDVVSVRSRTVSVSSILSAWEEGSEIAAVRKPDVSVEIVYSMEPENVAEVEGQSTSAKNANHDNDDQSLLGGLPYLGVTSSIPPSRSLMYFLAEEELEEVPLQRPKKKDRPAYPYKVNPEMFAQNGKEIDPGPARADQEAAMEGKGKRGATESEVVQLDGSDSSELDFGEGIPDSVLATMDIP